MSDQPLSIPGKTDSATLLVGLDIGGTKTAVLIVDQQLQPRAHLIMPTETADPDRLLGGIVRAVSLALEQAAPARRAEPIAGIGVGVPGQVYPATGEVRQAVNLNLVTYPLGPALSAAFNAPCLLENDARAAAMGAYQQAQQSAPVRHLAYLTIGTGIAAGLVLDGRLYRGAHGMAGEIGHILMEPDGARCNCGARGCLEALAAGPAIARLAAQMMPQQRGQPLTAATVYQAAAHGDPAAQRVTQRVSHYLSRAIQWLIMSYDVERVVLGGGVARAGDAFLQPILQALAGLRAQSALAEAMLPDEKVALLPPGYDAGVWGAIWLARQAAHPANQ
jgi:glucokinase